MTIVPLAGVIGHPVGHSRSPRLHGHWLHTRGIIGHYVPLDVAAADLPAVLRLLPRIGFRGVNVTIPHKGAVLALADDVTPLARKVGAANTLTFVNGTIHADNTDGYGFMANLRDGAPKWRPGDGPALILGAGGAARAIIVALADAGTSEIRLVNRTRARAEELAAELGGPLRVLDWSERATGAECAALVVNTTALGMQGQPPLGFPATALAPETVVTDIVYTPLVTPLLASAHDRGCTVVDGLGMLLHQAAPGFARWFGEVPEVTPELRAHVLAP